MAMTDPFEPARRRKRRIGWYLVAVGAFLALRELVEGSPITNLATNLATLAAIGVSVGLIAWGRYWIVSNPKGPFSPAAASSATPRESVLLGGRPCRCSPRHSDCSARTQATETPSHRATRRARRGFDRERSRRPTQYRRSQDTRGWRLSTLGRSGRGPAARGPPSASEGHSRAAE